MAKLLRNGALGHQPVGDEAAQVLEELLLGQLDAVSAGVVKMAPSGFGIPEP